MWVLNIFPIIILIVIIPELCTKSWDLGVIKELKLQIMFTRLVGKLIVLRRPDFYPSREIFNAYTIVQRAVLTKQEVKMDEKDLQSIPIL